MAEAKGSGLVSLVGAGPGDPELLTLKAQRRLQQAGAVLYDELVNRDLLHWAPADAERVYVGKNEFRHSVPQELIAEMLVERARRGLRVVRLKGGDPFVFGRGGEEVERLVAAGVAWEVVPGISSGIAAASAAAIPVTHRGVSSSVTFMSGHVAEEMENTSGETLVIFMGLGRLQELTAALRRKGHADATPVAVISHGTQPTQRVVTGVLSDIADKAAHAGLTSPALIVLGDVVKFREQWLGQETGPLPARRLPALILMAHGSPVQSWHDSIDRLVASLARTGRYCRAAYLPKAEPQLLEVIGQAVADGQHSIVVVPYFLAEGLHVTEDIPELVAQARQRYPQVEIALSPSLEGHPALLTAVLARAAEGAALLPQTSS